MLVFISMIFISNLEIEPGGPYNSEIHRKSLKMQCCKMTPILGILFRYGNTDYSNGRVNKFSHNIQNDEREF